METPYGFRTADSDEERSAFATILHRSYGYSLPASRAWLKEAGAENVRVLLDGDEVVGGLFRLPMGQFFGGESVPCCGISGVAVAPSARGQGTATRLIQREVHNLAEEGWALSTLWGATEPLYRRAGYAIAGGYYRLEIQARDIMGGARCLPMRAFEERDEEAVRSLYRRFAARRPGWLDRGSYAWGRTRRRRDEEAMGFVVEGKDGLVGYCFLRHTATEWGFHLELRDLVYEHRDAARTLLAFLADQRSLGERVAWMTSPDDSLPSLLKDRHYDMRRPFTWMTRILDVKKALEGRGYPPFVTGELALDVADDIIAGNAGRFLLRADGGRVAVERGAGGGDLRIDVRALAALYTGHHGVDRLLETDRIEGSADSLELARALFTGPAPSCADYF